MQTVDNNTGVVTPVKGMYGTTIILVKSGAVQSLIRIKIKPSETDEPKSVASPMVSAGSAHTIALRYDGTVWAWATTKTENLDREIQQVYIVRYK